MKKFFLFGVIVAAMLFAIPAQAFYWNFAEHETPSFFDRQTHFQPAPIGSKIAAEKAKMLGVSGTRSAAPRNKVAFNDDIITEIPSTAEVKYYTRSGYYHAYDSYYDSYSLEEQSGNATIAFDGNDVYLQNPIAGYDNNAWIKGTKDGNTITFPLKQFLTYSSTYNYGLYITMADMTGSFEGTNDMDATTISYTISEDGKTITQQGTSENRIFTLAWSDDDTVYLYGAPGGEYSTVFTLDESYVPPSTDLVELPVGAQVEQWYATGAGSVAAPEVMNVAFVGSDVYVGGLFADFPNAWIKGSISGTTATFESVQYIGDSGTYHVWVVGFDSSGAFMDNFTMTFDATANKLTLDPNQYVMANAKDTEMSYFAYYQALTLMKELPAPVQIDELPYSNDFSTSDLQDEFKIIDVNGDGTTWAWYSGMARIKWADVNDDWLVSPLIKLEAGKTYAISFQAKAESTNYPETIEVKAATEVLSSALAAGVEVMASTAVSSTTFATFGNTAFTVAETGYYCFGIHNTSEDQYYCYIDDFLVEEVAPTYYLAGNMNGWSVSDNYLLALNAEATGEEYMITLDLEADAEFKVVSSTDGQNVQNWYPDNAGNYVVNEAGNYTVYFRPMLMVAMTGIITASM